ncbi:hypothetical protein AV654_17705 [Paenibacillus elgii]|uniref:Uncharacterized protein n=1 Tax=Paenibacillus elgii TaxID=189691 RepID=A0A161S430_9BACL|nr:hypothetical protein [Paenibacillus elgii]KZE79304.1 hypothetical protein AV654_17705 [Paenibacillus elgii]
MLIFTERIGEIELTYSGETVEDVVKLRQALNPSVISARLDDLSEEERMDFLSQIQRDIAGKVLAEFKESGHS